MPVTAPQQHWIGADTTSAPLFRHEFLCDQPVSQATLLISGLGCHEAWLNGRRVSDHVMDPSQTDYELRVLYVRHDVTHMLRDGSNAIGLILGNGWYNQDRVWGKNGLSYGKPRLMAELHLHYADGTTTVIGADPQWRWTPGPIVENNVYAGEVYDARLEIDGWCEPGFDDSSWEPAVSMPPPGGHLEEQVMPPMKKVEELQPTSITEIAPGINVVDFGQNFAGWVRIEVTAPPGTEISLRSAETLFPDGNIDTSTTGTFATKVEQIDRYICRGGGVETWEPRFTYHGFRHVEVSGWPGSLSTDQIIGVVIHNDLPIAGSFESSDERLNQLHKMALWTHRSNMHGLPEDCPAREKCGWLGDANLVAEYSLWNCDAKSFWEKYLGDIETTRTFNDGIPGNIAPGKRCSRNKANPDWAAAFVMLPWYIYQHSGDKSVLKQHWDGMQQLMRYFKVCSEDWILPGGFGDYFDPGTDAIVVHTPPTLSTSLWFYRCTDVMASMADALEDPASNAEYRNWSSSIAEAVSANFYDQAQGSFGSQTANAMALAFRILPDEDSRILDALVNDIREHETHMNVGVMGVRFLLEVLTERGHGDLALALMHQGTYPSFGHLIRLGATTLWECWGEAEHNSTHGPRSQNHPFMGGYDNWFFNTLAGIRPDPENPGFRHFFLRPHPIDGLEWIRCHHDSACGRIVSSWTLKDGRFKWHTEVPPGASATATMPFTHDKLELEAGKYDLEGVDPHQSNENG